MLFIDLFALQYKIEKKVETVEETKMEPDNPLMRKKKTPEELAKEAEEADLDDLTSELPSFIICSWFFITYRITDQFLWGREGQGRG